MDFGRWLWQNFTNEEKDQVDISLQRVLEGSLAIRNDLFTESRLEYKKVGMNIPPDEKTDARIEAGCLLTTEWRLMLSVPEDEQDVAIMEQLSALFHRDDVLSKQAVREAEERDVSSSAHDTLSSI